MSQVKFKSECRGKPVEVMAGWDRPLGHYYLTIFDLSPDAEEETLWSTLDALPGGGASSVTPLFGQLYTLGIQEPDGFWEQVQKQDGNVVTSHVDGKWRRTEF
jgi:hypothetical protein